MKSKEERNEISKQWNKNNPDKVKRNHERYYLENKDKILQQGKEWRTNNKERHAKMSAVWYRRTKEENLKKYLWKYARARAIKKQLPFTITPEDIIIPNICPIFKVPFIIGDKKYCPSIDRIVPELGYTKENIQIICSLANMMKWNSTKEELLIFCKGFIKFFDGGDNQS